MVRSYSPEVAGAELINGNGNGAGHDTRQLGQPSSGPSGEPGNGSANGGSDGDKPKAPKVKKWIPALAGYRALAAFAVLVFHIISIDSRTDTLGRWIVPLGPAAVATFFTLSGFLVYRPFAAWAFGDGPPISYWRYCVRRAARILPLYWVVLTVHLFYLEPDISSWGDFFTMHHTWDEIITSYTLTQTFRGGMVFIPPFVAWSLSIELWFSFALPLIAFVFRWLGNWRPWNHRFRIQLIGLSVLAASSILFRVWAFQSPGSGRNLWVPAYFDWFGAGLALAVMAHHWSRVEPPRWVKQVADRPWMPLSLSLAAYWAITELGLPVGFVRPTNFQAHIQFVLQAVVAFTVVASATLPGSRVARSEGILASGMFAKLGAWSYGLYLIHDMVIDFILERESLADMNRILMTVVVTVVTLAICAPLYYLVEQPASAFVDKMVKRVPNKVRPKNKIEAVVPASPTVPANYLVVAPAAAPPSRELVVQVPRLDSGRFTSRPIAPVKAFAEEPWLSPNRPVGMTLIAVFMSLLATVAAKPGFYVADSRFEMFSDPFSRLARMFDLWDPTRDLGRVAEEFWPGLTLASSVVAAFGIEPWLHQRLIHAGLLAFAATGAMTLSRTFRPQLGWPTLVVGAIYAFGPFSAVYLVPSPLYVSHVIAPWLVVAVVRAARGDRTFFWASITCLALLSAGNADPPGLVFACVPAGITWLAMMVAEPHSRRKLLAFAGFSGFVTMIGSAAMLFKTATGAVALSQRLTETEAVDVVAATTSFSETIRGMGLWLTLFRLAPEQIRTQQLIYTDDTLGVAITYLPVLAAVGSLLWIRTRYALLAASWIIVGTVIASGPHPLDNPSPYGRLVSWLYDNSELAFGFRSTHKAGSIIILGVALLGGWTLAGVAGRGYPKLGWFRWVPPVIIVVFVGILARPFWRTPLYDPAFQSDEAVPAHWQELADWFETNPPEGRVLVLPGSTNNGYEWGDIGDDLLDPTIPNRVVSSFLPLSTSTGADAIKEIDDSATSSQYRPGSFLPMAQRLGITQVVIRNDLDWEVQQLPPPEALARFRDDPDIELVETFGRFGEGGAPAAFSPIELYNVPVQPSDATYVAQDDEGSVILIDGSSRAMLDAAAAGLLDGGQPVRNAPLVDDTSEREVLRAISEAPLVVLTDTLVAERRRINYYRYQEIPARPGEEPNPWLIDYDPESYVWPTVEGARVSSNLNPWFMDQNQPTAAVDSDPFTYWQVPFFEDSGTLYINFDEIQDSQTFEFDLVDLGTRVGAITVMVDDRKVTWTRADDVISVDTGGSFKSVAIRLPSGRSGTELLGIREVRFEEPLLLTAELSPRLHQLFEEAGSPDVPVALLMGSRSPEFARWQRVFRLWTEDSYTISADVTAVEAPLGCLDDVLIIDGVDVPVRVVQEGNEDGRLQLCGSASSVRLTPGRHVIEMNPPIGVQVGQLRVVPKGFRPPQADTSPLNEGDAVAPGGLVVSNYSFDERLRADIGGTLVEPEVLNGMAAFTVPPGGGTFNRVFLPAERSFDLAWIVSGLGVLLALAGLVVEPIPKRWLVGRRRVGPAGWTRTLAHASPALVLIAAYLLADVWGLAGAVATLVTARFGRWLWAVAVVGVAVVAMAVVAAWPTLSDGGVDPTDADFIGRVVIGGLLTLVVWIERRRRLES